jgi:hypothetical protein
MGTAHDDPMNPKAFTFFRNTPRNPCPLALSSMRQMDEVSGAHQIFQVAGFHLLAGHDLLDGRELENHAQNGGHCAMIPVGLIVENQVLQLAPLDSHQHGAVGGGDGGEHALGARVELD